MLQVKRQQGSSVGVDDEIDNYDYNNENDRENFCADLGVSFSTKQIKLNITVTD